MENKPANLPACSPLPVGTRIRFLKTLTSGPDDYGPGNHYATKGQLGTVAESPYGPDASPPREGHWVFWDGWPSAQFGATIGEDFEIHSEIPSSKPRLVCLMQCGRRSCSHVLIEDEYKWVRDGIGKTAVCPLCGFDDFYSLNASGQKRSFRDATAEDEIDPATIEPSPRMGLKMKEQLLAAKQRALAATSSH